MHLPGHGYGFVSTVTVVTPESVVISGAETLLRTIDAWSTVHRSFGSIRAPLEADLDLAPSTTYRVALSERRVHMRLDVEPFAEKSTTGLPVGIVAGAPNRELILIPPRIDLVVRGGIKQLAVLGPGDFHVSVDYRNVLADSSGTVEADVDSPPGVQVVARKPDRLQYVVRKRL